MKNYDEKNIPKKIEEIRKFRQSMIKETKIVELTKKYQFERYSFSRLTDNNVFDYIRNYLAAFHLNTFRQIEGKTKKSCEIWLKNE